MNNKYESYPDRRRFITGLNTAIVLTAWHKPLINSVVLPAHAQTSILPTPEELCAAIEARVTVQGPVSGSSIPAVCTAIFEFISADPLNNLTISNIETSNFSSDTTLDITGLGEASSTSGPQVVWNGPATDAPFCTSAMPIEDITFTVTASCDVVDTTVTNGESFVQEFTLSTILSS